MTFRFTYDPRECHRALRLARRLRRRTPSRLFAVPCLVALGWLVAEPAGAKAAGAMLPTVSWIAVLFFLVYGLVPLVTVHAAYRVRWRDPVLAGAATPRGPPPAVFRCPLPHPPPHAPCHLADP